MYQNTIKELFGINPVSHNRTVPQSKHIVDCENEVTSFDNNNIIFDTQGKTELFINNSPHVSIDNIHCYKIIDITANEITVNCEIVATKCLVLNADKITVNRKITTPIVKVRSGAIVHVLNPESDMKNITEESYFVYTVPTFKDEFVTIYVPEDTNILDMLKPKIDPNNPNEVICELLRRMIPMGTVVGEIDEDIIKLLEGFIKDGKITKEEVMENFGKYFNEGFAQNQNDIVKISTKDKTNEEVLDELSKAASNTNITIVETKEEENTSAPLHTTLVTDDEPNVLPKSNKASTKTINKPNAKKVVVIDEE